MAVTSTHPLAGVPRMIARGVRKNTAGLRYNIRVLDKRTGSDEVKTFSRTVYLYGISNVESFLVLNGMYQSGDIRIVVPQKEIISSRDAQTGDPTVTIGGVVKTLEELRPWNNMRAGLEAGMDTFVVDGVECSIVKIEPEDFWNGQASKYKVVARPK